MTRRKVQRKVHAKMLLNAFGVNFLFACWKTAPFALGRSSGERKKLYRQRREPFAGRRRACRRLLKRWNISPVFADKQMKKQERDRSEGKVPRLQWRGAYNIIT